MGFSISYQTDENGTPQIVVSDSSSVNEKTIREWCDEQKLARQRKGIKKNNMSTQRI